MLTFRATVNILNHLEKCEFTRFISLWYHQAIKFIKSNQLIYVHNLLILAIFVF